MSYRVSASVPVQDLSADLRWTLALAGGDGTRLAEYVERRFGQRLPKQYCALLGERSMLQHTHARLLALAPASRSLTVIGAHQESLATPQLAGISDHVFRQPAARDTGVALYVALALIKRWTPNAVVTVTPADHYVAPAARYVALVASAQQTAAKLRDKVILLGATPTEPDPELGYLVRGEALSEIPSVHGVAGFVEKPSRGDAAALIAEGALWNTMVTSGTVDALWELGREAEPQLIDILDSFVPLVGTADEDDALDSIYRAYLPVNFSRSMLERVPARLAAMEMSGVDWSDWGKPDRVEAVLARHRTEPQAPGLALR